MVLFGFLIISGATQGATNYFTGAVNGRLNIDGNWSEGVYTAWDDAVLTADSWGLQSGLNAFAEVKFTTITVNSNVNAFSAGTLQIATQSSASIYTKKLTVEPSVAKDVKLSGSWFIPTGGAAFTAEIYHAGSEILLMYANWGEHVYNPGGLKIVGDNTNRVTIAAASAYTGPTTLDNVNVRVATTATASSGPLGSGGDVLLQNSAVLSLIGGATITNASITVSEGTVLDVTERTGGALTYEGTLSGKGTLVGDYTVIGILRPGPGTGTLIFEDNLSVTETSKVSFEIFTNSVDVIANDGEDTLTVVEGSEWVFNFSGWTEGGPSNGQSFAVLQDWGSISGSSTNITVTGLEAGYGIDVSDLFTTGEIQVVLESFEIGDIGISVHSSDAIISWQGLSGITYALQRSENLTVSNGWETVGSVVSGIDGTVSVTNDLGLGAAFYRVIPE
jgi:hypothetical protein